MMDLGYMGLKKGRPKCRLSVLDLVLCGLLDTDTDAHDDDKFNNSSVYQLVVWFTEGTEP